jgi:hypothetical protein
VPRCCEHGNEHSVYINSWLFLEQLNDSFLIKKDCVPPSYIWPHRPYVACVFQIVTTTLGLQIISVMETGVSCPENKRDRR